MYFENNRQVGSIALVLISSFFIYGHGRLIESCCTTTLYPQICYSTLSSSSFLATKKDIIQLTINKTKDIIQNNFHAINNLLTPTTTKRTKIALHDCLDMLLRTLEALDTVMQYLATYNPTNKYSLIRQHVDHLKTLISTTITNKETCLDGFSHDKPFAKSIIQPQLDHGGKMCSNVLAMINNMTDTDMMHANQLNNILGTTTRRRRRRKLKEVDLWPQWLSARDRKLLWWSVVTPNVFVAKDGHGNYTTVEAAVAAAPLGSKSRYIIKIGAGVYNEYIEIPKKKTNIMLIGDGRSTTIITGNKSVAGGSTTTKSATVAALGDGFLAKDITFQNTAGPSGSQAVALLVASDLSAFYRCSMLGYQDTLYVHSNRQFYVNCQVVGTVDFIFGNAAVIFQFCDIQARRPNPGQGNMITAQGRTDPNQNTGIVIQKCKIGATSDLKPVQANFSTYLGRPWKEYSRTVVMRSLIDEVIKPAGWSPWEGDFALETLYYREYRNIGPGADTSKRVGWKGWGVIKSRSEAIPFTTTTFINAWNWLLSTGFPFWPGL
ncbi:pectinesterase-like [Cynara cardunculus var. scolymus]|uniref:pectinesterase-like n=1 Tax=Cynara cardunculus var. scolymus TaxID=59895 RepID=UPI000D62566E|nr:pectinesterase-like [Cynara cardunculus var. scolymus]